MKRSGKPLSMRMVKNLVALYARAGLTEKGLELLKRSDLKAFSYQETLGKSKIISFYDLRCSTTWRRFMVRRAWPISRRPRPTRK